MIKVEFTPDETATWKAWIDSCVRAQAELNRDRSTGGRSKANSKLYRAQCKDVFFHPQGPFYGKCVYCEAKLRSAQPGDIDHFRPKDGVRDADNRQITLVNDSGDEVLHPGYYWLTYNWQNLLPTCALCNRPSKDWDTQILHGKGERFPVLAFRAVAEGEEKDEEPLLLNPVVDDPADHLLLDPATGVLGWRTDRGRVTIDILGLNSRERADRRKEAYQNARERALAWSGCSSSQDPSTQHLFQELMRVKRGEVEYSLAGRGALGDVKAEVEARLGHLGGA